MLYFICKAKCTKVFQVEGNAWLENICLPMFVQGRGLQMYDINQKTKIDKYNHNNPSKYIKRIATFR